MNALQYITNQQGEKISVVLPIEEYETLIEAYEELEDICLYDEVKERNEESIPLSDFIKLREKRKHG